MRLYDRLFTVPNPAAESDFHSVMNPESLNVLDGAKVEQSLANAKPETSFSI